MSPSARIAGSFVAGESALLAFIVHRNTRNDRANALLHVPFLVQEALQVVLWPCIGDSPDSCSELNRWLSFGVCLVIFAVPGWMTTVHICLWDERECGILEVLLNRFMDMIPWNMKGATDRTDTGYVACKLLRRVLMVNLLLSGIFYVVTISVIGLAMRKGSWPSCTYSGPWGHQVWPVYLGPWWATAMIVSCFAGLFSLVLLGYFNRGDSVVVPAFLFLGGPLFAVLCFLMSNPPEYGSVLCSFASGMVVLYLLEPCIFAFLHEIGWTGFDYSLDSPTNSGRLCMQLGTLLGRAFPKRLAFSQFASPSSQQERLLVHRAHKKRGKRGCKEKKRAGAPIGREYAVDDCIMLVRTEAPEDKARFLDVESELAEFVDSDFD